MSIRNDSDFHVERERQERALADCARDPAIAKIHLDMAEHYAGLARAAADASKARRPRPILRLGANDR